MTAAERTAYHCVHVDREDPTSWAFACVDALSREGKLAAPEATALLVSLTYGDYYDGTY